MKKLEFDRWVIALPNEARAGIRQISALASRIRRTRRQPDVDGGG
jgi:hypothetical protein